MVSKVLVKKELQENRVLFIIALIIFGAFALIYPQLYELTKNALNTANVNELPQYFRDMIQQTLSFNGFAWNMWFLEVLHTYAPPLAIIIGMGLIARETARDTIGFILTKPFKRSTVFYSKYLSGAIILLAILLVTTAIYFISVTATGNAFEFTFADMFLGALNAYATLLLLYSLAALLSVSLNDRLKAGLITGLVAIILGLPGFFPDYSKYSIYNFITNDKIISGQGFQILPFVLLLAVSIIISFVANRVFQSRQF